MSRCLRPESRFIFCATAKRNGTSSVVFKDKSDLPLTPRGRDQARACRAPSCRLHIDGSSAATICLQSGGPRPRRRSKSFLQTLGLRVMATYGSIGSPKIHIGDWEGLTWMEVQARHREIWEARERRPVERPGAGRRELARLATRSAILARRSEPTTHSRLAWRDSGGYCAAITFGLSHRTDERTSLAAGLRHSVCRGGSIAKFGGAEL